MKKQKSEQYMMAHLEDVPVEDLDLDALFQPAANRDEQLRRIREASAARLAEIDAETAAIIQAEQAAPSGKKSEQYNIASLDDPSSGGRK